MTAPDRREDVPPLPDAESPAHLRRTAAADLARWTADRLTELGFGCEIIATWEARSGERTAAHVITANPTPGWLASHSSTDTPEATAPLIDTETLAKALAAVSPEGTKYPDRLAAEYIRLAESSR